MKKLVITVLFALTLIIALTACGDKNLPSSYEGTVFTYGDTTLDLATTGELVTAITETRDAGDNIVITGHISPKRNIYVIFDKAKKAPVTEIYGTNFIFENNDVKTAVFSFNEMVCTYGGEMIGSDELGENEYISKLAFSEDGEEVIVTVSSPEGEDRTIEYARHPSHEHDHE